MSRAYVMKDGKVVGTHLLPPGMRIERPSVPAVPLLLASTSAPMDAPSMFQARDYAWRRWSPFRNRWPELLELDERVVRFEQRREDINAELRGLEEQRTAAEAADRDALAPKPIEQRRVRFSRQTLTGGAQDNPVLYGG